MAVDLYAQDLIARKLVHEIHVSERRSFRGCRRRWNWIFRENFYPVTTAKPLEFGVAYHRAMETIFNPTTWKFQLDVLGALAEKVFVETCWEQKKQYLWARQEFALEGEEEEDYEERVALGRGMIKYFVQEKLPELRKDYVPTHVEVSFDVPLFDAEGRHLLCKCLACRRAFAKAGGGKWKGNPIVYSGRVDAIMHDMQGGYFIVDWKKLRVGTPILTPEGWVPIEQLEAGDLVIGSSGRPTRVIGASPIYEAEPVWIVEFQDGTKIECSADHKWTVLDSYRKQVTLTTRELYYAPSYQRYAVPILSGPVEYGACVKDFYISPYALGALIAEGSFLRELDFSSKDGQTAELLVRELPETLKLQDNRQYGNNKWTIRPVTAGGFNGWKLSLSVLGLWSKKATEKFIPRPYLFASVEDRIALLQGLYDGDGLTSELRYCTCSSRLAEDVAHLVRSLGGCASISRSSERRHSNGETINKPEYFVNFWLPETISHCRLESKKSPTRRSKGMSRRLIKSVYPAGRIADMRCIAVDAPDCLYVTRDFVLTHNTAAQLRDIEIYLELDDQVASYVMSLRRKMNLNIRGFVYFEIRKAYPEPPKENKSRRLGRLYSVNANQSTDYETYSRHVAKHDKDAFEAGLYDDFLQHLKDAGLEYYRKSIITKTDYQLEQVELNTTLEALDMTDPNLRIYPMPGMFSCTNCAFREPCLSQNSGADYEYTLATMYVKQEPYYRRNRPPTTDKRGD